MKIIFLGHSKKSTPQKRTAARETKNTPKKRKMAEARFEAPTVQNLNVTGTLRVSGRQAVTKRLYCTFTTTENASPSSITPVTSAAGAKTPAL
ncbi:MAG: hypothetical protein EBZ77_06335, partial [Chitinophagia bacterium]|nr:hypothetical protein [Chitinophagia bacterium]